MTSHCSWCDARTDHASADHPTWLGLRRLPLGQDGATAVLDALERWRDERGWGDGGAVERMWTEQHGDDWEVVVHFWQGPRRYEHRVRHLLDSAGCESSPEDLAVDVVHCVVDEPHGPTAVTLPDGRHVVPAPEPMGRTAGTAEPRG